ncbi:chemotaxis-specific protein-glutamate methyltransferase CheB [Azospirillum soli]|uniref:chemotaxis-specific protein-glutamate methyltransferase CheB n=1 Tax=Azospirillum soli TaxID=1304799 RepID=UPI001AEAE3B9|nr:chemotaxis-specific protein-glutamate methyltransferase CheB [Azospirillum soli]MBP2312462.1 two-component system chemotaxis response regulator CheB [Azospirillum soli]
MTEPRIRLLVVDDSNFVRIALRKMLESATDIDIVGEARNGAEALRLSRKLKPDVIAMDLNMPIMDGIEAVQAISREKGPPSIMVSNETSEGAEATIRALEAGAVDFVCKNTSFVTLDFASIERQLTEKVRHWGRWRRTAEAPAPEPAPLPVRRTVSPGTVSPGAARRPDLVVVGVSTGGPVTLVELLGALDKLPCPLVVAQHMPASFTGGFATSLGRSLKRPVEEGADGSTLENGVVTILKGGIDWTVRRLPSGRFVLRSVPDSAEIYHPSANQLFRSAGTEAVAPVAVILTGMGDDGTEGAKTFAARNHHVLVQDPASCAVDGMPTSAIRAGVAGEVLPVASIARKLNHLFNIQEA